MTKPKRDKRLLISVTEEERNWVNGIAKKSIYGSTSNFCRALILQACAQLDNKSLDTDICVAKNRVFTI